MDPFELTRRLRAAPIDTVVDALRNIHQRGDGDTRTVRSKHRNAQTESASNLVATLRAIHERNLRTMGSSKTAAMFPARIGTSATLSDHETSYDRVRDHFHQHEASLRRQAWLTDQILDRMQTDDKPPESTRAVLQQEIRLCCPVGGSTGGAFVLANEFENRMQVSFRRSALRGAPVGYEGNGELRFNPKTLVLSRGEERVVRFSFDLSECPLVQGEEVGLVIDVVRDGALLQKLWVSIALTPATHAPEVE